MKITNIKWFTLVLLLTNSAWAGEAQLVSDPVKFLHCRYLYLNKWTQEMDISSHTQSKVVFNQISHRGGNLEMAFENEFSKGKVTLTLFRSEQGLDPSNANLKILLDSKPSGLVTESSQLFDLERGINPNYSFIVQASLTRPSGSNIDFGKYEGGLLVTGLKVWCQVSTDLLPK